MGYILYDVKCDSATQKLAKHRLDVISSNVNSYSRCLNDPTRLPMIYNVNAIAATCAKVSADIEANKRQKTEAAATKQQEIFKKKVCKELEEETKAKEL